MDNFLQGKLLIAMPSLTEPIFSTSVIVLCAHSAEGAMGIIVNRPLAGMSFLDLADQIDLSKITPEEAEKLSQTPVHMGGPVEQQRGFVLHSPDFEGEHTLQINAGASVTSTLDILQKLADGKGPGDFLLALGYAGWSPGQLENEILHNGWLHCDFEPGLVFSEEFSTIHARAMETIGVDPAKLSAIAGHA
jgi:putative transcriptional regulator